MGEGGSLGIELRRCDGLGACDGVKRFKCEGDLGIRWTRLFFKVPHTGVVQKLEFSGMRYCVCCCGTFLALHISPPRCGVLDAAKIALDGRDRFLARRRHSLPVC
jgi:hypothetical protein